MKKLLTVFILFISFKAFAQPTNYVPINSKYKLRALYPDSTLHIPSGSGAPTSITQLRSGYTGAGALYYDTVGNLVYIWNHGVGWSTVGAGGTWQQSLDLGSTLDKYNTINGGAFPFKFNNHSSFRFNLSTIDSLYYFGWAGTDRLTINYTNPAVVVKTATSSPLYLTGGMIAAEGIILAASPSGGNVRVAEDVAQQPLLKYYNPGAQHQATTGLETYNYFIRTYTDSVGIKFRAKDKAAVKIDSSRFTLAFCDSTAAANDLTLGFKGNIHAISGNTQINAITTFAWQKGSIVYLKFSGTPTVKHNTAGGGGTALIKLSGNSDYTVASGDLLVLLYDGVVWSEIGRYVAAVVGGGSNPTLQQVFNTEIGGSVLTKNDTINIGTRRLYFLGSTASRIIDVYNDDGVAMNITGTSASAALNVTNLSGVGISSTSTGGGVGAYLTTQDATDNTVLPLIKLDRASNSAGANGIGASLEYYLETSTTNSTLSGQIKNYFSTSTHASRESMYDITGIDNASTEVFMNIQKNLVRINNNADTLATLADVRAGGGGSSVTASSTTTFTNKRWIPRQDSTTSSATPTINTDNVDIYKLTAQAADITSFTTNLTGAPNHGEIIEIQITGTATRAITWGSAFVSSSVPLPTTTNSTNTLTVILQYYTNSSYGNFKWVCVNSY